MQNYSKIPTYTKTCSCLTCGQLLKLAFRCIDLAEALLSMTNWSDDGTIKVYLAIRTRFRKYYGTWYNWSISCSNKPMLTAYLFLQQITAADNFISSSTHTVKTQRMNAHDPQVLQAEVRAYSKRIPRTNCALRIKNCAPRISSGIYF